MLFNPILVLFIFAFYILTLPPLLPLSLLPSPLLLTLWGTTAALLLNISNASFEEWPCRSQKFMVHVSHTWVHPEPWFIGSLVSLETHALNSWHAACCDLIQERKIYLIWYGEEDAEEVVSGNRLWAANHDAGQDFCGKLTGVKLGTCPWLLPWLGV